MADAVSGISLGISTAKMDSGVGNGNRSSENDGQGVAPNGREADKLQQAVAAWRGGSYMTVYSLILCLG